jgi:hypothetical protein
LPPLARSAAILTLVLTACRGPAAEEQNNVISGEAASGAETSSIASASTYAGAGRDRLCLAEGRAGLIVYGKGDANCSVSGSAEGSGNRLTIVPAGDSTCRIQATLISDKLTLGEVSQACAYYCGPSASFAGKGFTRTPAPQPVTDLAGDPLC